MQRFVVATVAVIALSGTAYAAPFTISSAIGGAPSGATKDNLNWLPLGHGGGSQSGVTVTFVPDAGVVTGAESGKYAAPFLSNNSGLAFGDANGVDQSRYISSGKDGGATAGANATIAFAAEQVYFGLLWGSVDAYNALAFYHGAQLVGTVTGADVIALATGDQGQQGTSYVNIMSALPFNRVVATSSEYAFEFDDISYNPADPTDRAVPEPSALALLAVALVGAACKLRRERG